MSDLTPLPPDQTRYASYSRVSTEHQKEKQVSVPQQRRECAAWALARGGLLVREFQDEGFSGETTDRPGLQELLAWARAGADPKGGASVERQGGKQVVTRNAFVDTLVVWKLDRLSRPNEDDDIDFLVFRRDLRACGVSLASVTEAWVAGTTHMDAFMGYLGRGQSKVEKLQREERFRLGRQGIAEGEGRQVGPPPYGYIWQDPDHGRPLTGAERRKGRPWAVAEPQGAWVRYIFARYLAGDAINQITRALNAQGAPAPCTVGDGGERASIIRTHRGWVPDSVIHILTNRRYAGYVHHAGHWYTTEGKPGGHTALITLADWERAQAIREGRGRRRSASAQSLFAGGLLRCPHCATRGVDSRLVVFSKHCRRTLADGSEQRYFYTSYTCSVHFQERRKQRLGADTASESACPGFQVSQGVALSLLLFWLRAAAAPADPAELDKVRSALTPRRPNARAEADSLRAEVQRQLAQIPLIASNYSDQQAAGLLSLDHLREKLSALSVRESALRARLEAAPPPSDAEHLPAVDALRLLRLMEDESVPPLAKRDALHAVFLRLIPNADRKSLTIDPRP